MKLAFNLVIHSQERNDDHGSAKLLAHIENVNDDAFDDLVVQIQNEPGLLTSGNDVAILQGALFDGTAIRGGDAVILELWRIAPEG